ncbi:MAG: NADH-quinone oxidoreductase subunit I, partial [Candidatus Heimdallarchaeota archaeon]
KITILGEQIIDHKRKFKFPKSARIAFLPFQRFSKILQRYPKYKSGCINCQSCVKGCPEQVITIITNKKGEPQPRINLKGCIACYTCIEICPEACYGYESRTLRRVILIFSALLVVVAALITFLVLFLR